MGKWEGDGLKHFPQVQYSPQKKEEKTTGKEGMERGKEGGRKEGWKEGGREERGTGEGETERERVCVLAVELSRRGVCGVTDAGSGFGLVFQNCPMIPSISLVCKEQFQLPRDRCICQMGPNPSLVQRSLGLTIWG
jgi:hypothetical protein